MNRVASQLSDLQWIKQVHDLLIDVARASLADTPKLPDTVSTQALPLAQKAQSIQQKASANSAGNQSWQSQQSQWVEQVRQLLLELSRIALAERPKLPENIAQRALTLAETAQDIQEGLEDESSEEFDVNDHEDSDYQNGETALSVDGLLNVLKERLTGECNASKNPNDPQWQQLLTLVDVIEQTYKRIQQS